MNKLDAGGPGEWSFRKPEVALDFDRHVREQLPWYDLATGIVVHVGRHVIPKGGLVLDVGASTGNIGRALLPILQQREARLTAIDDSAEMKLAYEGPGTFIVKDVRQMDFPAADLIVCFLVLMFLPVTDRPALIERMKAALNRGGALVIVDKLEPPGGHAGIISSRLTLAAKYEAGASPDEIIKKELSLAGVQRPLRDDELAGLTPLFRFGDFAGFICCK